MAKRLKLKERLFTEENGEQEQEENKSKPVATMSSDDEEGNEDLSLKIVEKHLLMRAAKFEQDDADADVVLDEYATTDNNNKNDKNEGLGAVAVGHTDDVKGEDVNKSDKKRTRVRKKKKKEVDKLDIGEQSVIVEKEEQTVVIIDKDDLALKAVDNGNEAMETVDNSDEAVKDVEISDNIVLRKLLRGPRYFDPPDSGWQTCYNCGEEGHMAVNCASAIKRKRPCFVCGSLEHGVKQCSKVLDCFICKKSGHRAKDCPDKHNSDAHNAQVCLKCGETGHDMFSCRNSYSLDDLKEIQCYICKQFGHLCCVNVSHSGPREVSCFRCGQLGHSGLACGRSRGETAEAPPSSCYNCGGEGHFARECTSSSRFRKRNLDTFTPKLKPRRENKDYSGVKSAPHDLGKAHKKKKSKHEERGTTTPRKSKQRGGWITDDPRDISYEKPKRKLWRSPGTPSSKGHRMSTVTSGGQFSSPQSAKGRNSHLRFSASRFDNSGSDGIKRSYDWW